jgi:hypothetical protein
MIEFTDKSPLRSPNHGVYATETSDYITETSLGCTTARKPSTYTTSQNQLTVQKRDLSIKYTGVTVPL